MLCTMKLFDSRRILLSLLKNPRRFSSARLFIVSPERRPTVSRGKEQGAENARRNVRGDTAARFFQLGILGIRSPFSTVRFAFPSAVRRLAKPAVWTIGHDRFLTSRNAKHTSPLSRSLDDRTRPFPTSRNAKRTSPLSRSPRFLIQTACGRISQILF